MEEELLNELEKIKESAFSLTTPNLADLKTIKSLLYSVNRRNREFLKPFVSDLKQKLFENNITIQGLELKSYFDEDISKQRPKNKKSIVKIDEEDVDITFNELLKRLLECTKETISDLKGYAILKLANQGNVRWKVKVLYDRDYYFQPITKKIQKKFDECDSSLISEFSRHIENGYVSENNLLCLVLLTSKINNPEAKEETKKNLEIVLDSFDEFEYCTIKEFGNYNGQFYTRIVEKSDFLEEIDFVTSKFLSNGKVSFEEEKIIKKVFDELKTPVLSYKLLKSGHSGAKVIEIRPVKTITSGQYERRFIVKYSKIDEERKLKKEITNFGEFIGTYEGNDEYKCSHYKTSTYEALKYDFAKSPGTINSYSFADVLEDSGNPYYANSANLINELFKLRIFETWKDQSLEKSSVTLNELYSKYVKLDEIKEQVLKINHLSEEDFETSEFKQNLDKLLGYSLEVNKKICHGDLHSDNFFTDDKEKLFLIDFGLTGIEHAIIDNTSLECSIKFRHIPNYIPLDSLKKIEEELLLDETFNSSYSFRETRNRTDLSGYCDIIKQIRRESEKYLLDINDKTEYYISLFFMTYRQIRYPNLNQRYAYESACLILQKLIRDLSL